MLDDPAAAPTAAPLALPAPGTHRPGGKQAARLRPTRQLKPLRPTPKPRWPPTKAKGSALLKQQAADQAARQPKQRVDKLTNRPLPSPKPTDLKADAPASLRNLARASREPQRLPRAP
ncbi:MAG: hypothetical protein WKG07_22240 [Hymenobacter sp.]